ncbi:transcriptional regulator [Lactobacillus sp. LL6]|uniref:MarR family winged helix-turn-helix transcriptional regulator n=1 Tax=Lactobacillus sp. LL6 TaxID=2596827 RepID=UPI001185317E|nr:transcriptional regulator [Lactobacillus sp. LL6]TSO26773.1 transcriptional regulator [Lactobacillus sp. LL6]
MASEQRIYEAIKVMRENAQNAHSSHEQNWISEHLDNCKLKIIISKLSIVALHMLSSLEKGPQTGMELSCNINVTRGAITRASKNLLKYKLITTHKKETNRKNIYYELTDDGLEVAKAHDEMHCEMRKTVIDKIKKKYSTQELTLIADFLEDVNSLEQDF